MLLILGDIVPYAVPVAMSPLPIIATLMLLLAPSGTRGGLCFLVGRVAALAVLTLLVALLAEPLIGAPEAPERAGWLRIGLGVLVMAAGMVLWQRRPRAGATVALPKWMRSVERATPATALGLGALLTAANLKELAFVLGAGMILGSAAPPLAQAATLAVVFAGLAGLGVALPVVWALAAGDGARKPLTAGRDWLARNNAIIGAAVLLLVGAMLVGSGIESL